VQQYDISLKLILRGSGVGALQTLTGGAAVERWLDVEMPEVRSTRVDLLGEMAGGDLLHIELQSTNDPRMALRMAEYCLRVYRLFDRFPRQILLYVGNSPLRMETELNASKLAFGYEAVDIRDFDGERLLDSGFIGDNVIAILTRVRDRRLAIQRILSRIAALAPGDWEAALGQLLRVSGLRELEETVEREARAMPVFNPIMDNKVLGREIKRGIELGREQGVQLGVQQGMEQGMQQGELKLLRRLIEARFGPIPTWAQTRLGGLSTDHLEGLAVRILSAKSLDELLR
jgi:hypothetical protein